MTSRQLSQRKFMVGAVILILLAVAFCLGDYDSIVLLGSAALGLIIGCGLSWITYVDDDSRLAKYDLPAARNFVVAGVMGWIIGACADMSFWPWHTRTSDTMLLHIVCGFVVTFAYIAWPRRVEKTNEEKAS